MDSNPLLQRGKKSKKTKSKKAPPPKKPSVEPIQEAINGTISDAGSDEDLADKLLQQLGEKEEEQVANMPPPETVEKTFEKKISRQQARKTRKANEIQQIRAKAQAEVELADDQSANHEAEYIKSECKKLHLVLAEMQADGHCLYASIADQVNELNLSSESLNYLDMRKKAARYMRDHPDDFIGFLESSDSSDGIMSPDEYARYCNSVEYTSEWGGMAEINALAQCFKNPIFVLQSDTPLIRIGQEHLEAKTPMYISYHRKMYGLGEHYNSLRPVVPVS